MTKINFKKTKTVTTIIAALVIGLVLSPIGVVPAVNGQTTNGVPSEKTWVSPPVTPSPTNSMKIINNTALQKAGYVSTPIGYLPPECVVEVGNNARINRDHSVDLENGKHLVAPLNCKEKNLSSISSPATSNIVEYGGLCYCPTIPPAIKYFQGKWTVPPNPPQSGNQVIYLWTGLQATDYLSYPLIQPVLEWNQHGSHIWEIQSWFCDPNGAFCYQGPWYPTTVGASVTGTMSGSSCNSNGVCLFNIQTTDGSHTSSLNWGGYDSALYWIAGGVLEAQNVNGNCNLYPSRGTTPTTFGSYTVLNTNGNIVQPPFSGQVVNHDGCNENVSASSSQVSLYYGNR